MYSNLMNAKTYPMALGLLHEAHQATVNEVVSSQQLTDPDFLKVRRSLEAHPQIRPLRSLTTFSPIRNSQIHVAVATSRRRFWTPSVTNLKSKSQVS